MGLARLHRTAPLLAVLILAGASSRAAPAAVAASAAAPAAAFEPLACHVTATCPQVGSGESRRIARCAQATTVQITLARSTLHARVTAGGHRLRVLRIRRRLRVRLHLRAGRRAVRVQIVELRRGNRRVRTTISYRRC